MMRFSHSMPVIAVRGSSSDSFAYATEPRNTHWEKMVEKEIADRARALKADAGDTQHPDTASRGRRNTDKDPG